jgi:thioredoxin-like negative regulator of GroEL
LTLWLMQRGRTAQALAWLQSLPMSTQTNAPAALLLAECQMVTHDWSGLQKSLSKENWGDQEFRRHAYLARALRQQGFDEASKGEWDVASNSAKDRYEKLAMLFNLAAQWNWQDEAQQTLWTIVKAFPQQQWAAQRLSQLLYVNGNTRPLMQLFNMEVSRNPANLDAKNGLALTAMLLKAQEMNPYDLSREVYQKNPTNSYYACVYAFALHLQGKNAEALKIMQSIPSQSLKNTTTDGYYGVILKAAGDHTQADNYLKRSLSGQLLPEERDLFQQTMSGR